MVEYRPVTAAVAGSNPVNLVIVLRFCFEETNGGYSSVGRALPLQGRCQRFESAYLQVRSIAQLVEHLPYKQNVNGSSPFIPNFSS